MIYDRARVSSGVDLYARKNIQTSLFLLNPTKITDIEINNVFSIKDFG